MEPIFGLNMNFCAYKNTYCAFASNGGCNYFSCINPNVVFGSLIGTNKKDKKTENKDVNP